MAQPDYAAPGPLGLMWATASDPDGDRDDDSTPQGDTDHDYWSTDGRPMRSQAASGLPQIQQHTDPDNAPDPEGDQLPVGVAFPVGDNSPQSGFSQQWSTGPDGPHPRTAYKADMDPGMAEAMAHADVSNGRGARHQEDFGSNSKQHGKYLRTWNNLAGLMHGLTGRSAMSKAEYGKQTGRPDLHSHYLAAYAQGYAQSHTAPRADDGGQATASLRVQADTWSQPHQSTDDLNPPYNSAETSPDPWSQQQGGDYQAGAAAGRSDRAAGERPLFADNSSAVSPYVKGYAEGYGGAGGPSGPQDVPRSMGGDSGQPMNAQRAQQSFQVARASRRKTAAHEELNAHMQLDHGTAPGPGDISDQHMILHERGNAGHFYESYPENGRTASVQDAWENARDSLETRHRVDGGHAVSGAPGDERLDGEGTGGRSGATWKTSSLRRASASFAPDSLMRDPEFRKGYLFARQWQRGQRLAGKGSARFEAGLYAGMTDNPRAQVAWTAAHTAQGTRHRELIRRMGLHQSFTAKKLGVYGHAPMYLYRQAGTSTDLVTDGPGTSPDPMGSTPLNGPGTPPPMAGRDEAAQPGGAPPYQGAPPLPGGPVVPDDVMGPSQRAAEPSGAFTNTFSGQHPENALLAPVAPNQAAQSGYVNQGAYPRGNDRLAAFRRRVQAGLAEMGAR